jgi:hypothetical protein
MNILSRLLRRFLGQEPDAHRDPPVTYQGVEPAVVSLIKDASADSSERRVLPGEISEDTWNRLVAADRAEKERVYGMNPASLGQMPDAYYQRKHREGEFSRDGGAVYLDRSNLTPTPSIEGAETRWDGVMRVGITGVWYSGTSLNAMVVAVYDKGKAIYIIREYGSALIRLTLQKDGRFKEPWTQNYFLPGATGSNYLSLKRWWTREQLARPRYPHDLTAVADAVERLEAERVYNLPSNKKKREVERASKREAWEAKRAGLALARALAEKEKAARKAQRESDAAEAKRRRENPTASEID